LEIGVLEGAKDRGVTRLWCIARRSAVVLTLLALRPVSASTPETVRFDSEDGKTSLVAYLYKAGGPGPHPAVVALHGRSGLYSNKATHYDAKTLSLRHKMWGEFWAERGYLVLFVDSFGPRGYPTGFAAGTIDVRPREADPVNARPLDAYAGLKYLRSRSDVAANQVFLQGWSNGGATTLAALERGAPGRPTGEAGFRAGIAQYPACRPLWDHYGARYQAYAPIILLIGTHDEEVKPSTCETLARWAKSNGNNLEIVLYDGATHGYDNPTTKVGANVPAAEDTKRRAEAFFQQHRN
jgi:carboxymethylenebutenolidase